jgi:hypothetical protein
LLGFMRDKLAALAALEAKGDFAAKIPSTGFLIRLHLPYPFPDAVAFGLGEGGSDCQE